MMACKAALLLPGRCQHREAGAGPGLFRQSDFQAIRIIAGGLVGGVVARRGFLGSRFQCLS